MVLFCVIGGLFKKGENALHLLESVCSRSASESVLVFAWSHTDPLYFPYRNKKVNIFLT